MIEIVPATADLADQISLQSAQQMFGMKLTRDRLADFIRQGPAFAAIDNKVIAMAGIIPVWEDRAVAWGLLSDGIGARMPSIHKAVLRGLDGLFLYKRVEAYVASEHREGGRWCAILGFQFEGRMRSFHNGHDFDLWARVRG